MSEIRTTKTLFDATSIHATDYSLVFFSFRDQATVQAVGLGPDDVITFETVLLKSGTPDEYCGCFVAPGKMPSIAAVEKLMCFECGTGTGEAAQPVRLTASNPIVVLNAPQGVLMRAHFEGPGLGTAEVWATLGTDTTHLLPGMDGCPGVCCVDTEWTENGVKRCNLADDLLEVQEVSNCGNTRWVEAGPLNWQASGVARCNLVDDTVEVQEVNDCGDVRWLPGEPINWVATGLTRCVDNVEQEQQINDCGDMRWEDTELSCGWLPTYELPCGGLAFRPEDLRDPEATVEIDGCGGDVVAYLYPEPRPWATKPITDCESCDGGGEVVGYAYEGGKAACDPCQGDPGEWVRTGVRRNAGDASLTQYKVERQEVNGCGHYDWKPDGLLPWTETGRIRCAADGVEQEQTTIFGDTRWDVKEPLVWTLTGNERCSGLTPAGDTYAVEAQEANQCGETRWVDVPRAAWEDTGSTRCATANDVDIELLQTTKCGDTRWVLSETRTQAWSDTGTRSCDDVSVFAHEQNDCGRFRKVAIRPNTWEETGVDRCRDNLVEFQEVNQCGNIRWATTAVSCGYLPTYQLPCGGLAFRPTDLRDPEATVALEACDGEAVAYIYPTPRQGASTPVTDCQTCADGENIFGYAADGGLPNLCFGEPDAVAVSTVTIGGLAYILWSNGRTTLLK